QGRKDMRSLDASELKEQRAAIEARRTEIEAARQGLALKSTQGDAAAKKRLTTLRTEGAGLSAELEIITAAIGEAEQQTKDAEAAAAAKADAELGRRQVAQVEKVKKLAAELDDAESRAVALFKSLRAELSTLHGLGVGPRGEI